MNTEDEWPPVILENGTKQWWRYGCLHREGGPAVEWADTGTKEWIVYGDIHRADGPAIEFRDGRKQWYYKDEYVFCNSSFLKLEGNYVLLERGIPTDAMFGELEITMAKLLTANGTFFVYDNLPGLDIGEGND